MPPLIAPDADIDPATVETQFADVIELTREIFGGDVRIEIDPDPEIAGLTNIFFFATTCEGSAAIIDHQMEWHRRLEERPTGLDRRLRLCVRSV